MTFAVGGWSMAAAAHAFAGGFFGFGALRALLGAGEGATFPGGLRTVTLTLPPAKRGRGLAIAYSGGSLGAMITPLIVTPIALRFGWHGAFIVTGSLGLAWLVLWRFVSRGIDRAPAVRTTPPILWKERALWAYIAFYAIGAMPLGLILNLSSLYLYARFGWNQATLGKVLWIPPLGWEIGYFVWGAALDRLGPRFRGLMLTSLAFTAPLAWLHSLPTGPAVLGGMFVSMFALSGFVVLSVHYATRSFAADHAGLLAGIGAGSWGAVGALTSPWFGRLFDHGEYRLAFRIAAVFPVAGWALWRLLSGSNGTGILYKDHAQDPASPTG